MYIHEHKCGNIILMRLHFAWIFLVIVFLFFYNLIQLTVLSVRAIKKALHILVDFYRLKFVNTNLVRRMHERFFSENKKFRFIFLYQVSGIEW